MTDISYSTDPGSVGSVIQSIVPQGILSQRTQNAILQALQANGLLGKDDARIGIDYVPSPDAATVIDGDRDQVAILGPNADTRVSSTKPVVVALSSGQNLVSLVDLDRIAAPSAGHDRPAFEGGARRAQADTVIGGSGRDTIVGNAAATLLRAGSGRELLVSGGGRDTLSGGAGRDTLVGGGRSYIAAGTGPTTIEAGQGSRGFPGVPHDTVQAGSGQDSITLTYGNNTVYAPRGGGAATINAGSGSDTIYGPAAFQGAETVNSDRGGHTTFHLGSGAVTYNLSSRSADTVFGGQGGFLNLNRATTDIASAARTTVDGQSAVIYTFAGGGSVTAVGTVNITFTNTRHGG